MADSDLQALLDPTGMGRGIMIARREGGASDTYTGYYVTPQVGPYAGRSRWVRVTRADSDATKATAIAAALAKP